MSLDDQAHMDERHDALIKSCYEDVPLLLAAVEAALELHQPEIFDGRDADGMEFSSRECATCDNGGLRDNWPCGTYLAIAAALGGPGQ